MKKVTNLTLLILISISVFSQIDNNDIKIKEIDVEVRNYPLKIDLSTPLSSHISREYLFYSGKKSLWNEISTYQFDDIQNPNTPDIEVSEERKENVLSTVIKELITYKDSVAVVITYDKSVPGYYINMSRLENGKWVNSGQQDPNQTIEEARARLPRIFNYQYQALKRVDRLLDYPIDTKPFTDYIKKNGQTPKDFILNTLKEKNIVIYGERHRRKISWDLLRDVINDPEFVKTTGTVFMELPSYMQPTMDEFIRKEILDTELLLNIFREEQPHGWWCRGKYDFLSELWKLNKSLKDSEKINVILVDFQIPYSGIKDKQEYENCYQINRNLHMANVIEDFINSTNDKRNHLFVVGYGHAYKSEVPGGGSTPRGHKVEKTAAALLVERFSDNNIFSILQHVGEYNGWGKLILPRNGFFDKVFQEAGNIPIAFPLKNSPFGSEPFDYPGGMKFDPLAGSFNDNFDGYIFLQPLKDEMHDYVLYEIFTDEFVKEMKRRANYMGIDENRIHWFNTPVNEMTAEKIKEILWDYSEGKRRYPDMR